MKLFIKQEPFSWMTIYTVKDAKGADKYTIEGQLLSEGHKLHIYDSNKIEVGTVQSKLSGLRPRAEISQRGKVTAEVQKKRAGLKTTYVISGSDWTIRGDFRTHDYALMGGYGNALVVKIIQQEGEPYYELEISNTADEIKVLATALILDFVLDEVK